MKKIIETIKNIWRIEDLRTRLLITILFVAVYRFGSFIVLPGIDPARLQALQSQTSEGLMSLLNMFSGGAFSNASVFALGIMPYISASIVIQLLAMAVPYFQKMQREGESGRRKINQITRWLTIAILLFQAPTYLINLKAQTAGSGAFLVGDGLWFMISSTIILAAGSMFILWLGERITDKGVGNGVSLIIMIGIIARMPSAFVAEFVTAFSGAEGGGLIKFLFEIIALLFVMALAIMLVKATRKVPVQYAQRIEGKRAVGGAVSAVQAGGVSGGDGDGGAAGGADRRAGLGLRADAGHDGQLRAGAADIHYFFCIGGERMISETLRTWLLGIIAAGMVIGVLYALLPKGRMKPIAHAAGGAALLLVIVQPVLELDFMEFAGKYEDYEREIEELTEAYRQADQEKLAELIADKTAAYIASKGDALGLDCTPQVETQPREGVPYPSAVTLDIPEDAALAAWISEELAIDRAHQYWREADE